jgi:hypothetical protein
MEPLYTATTDRFKLEIIPDDDGYASNPRDNDNAGTMITWERQYGSPDPNDWERRDESGFLAFRMDWLPTTATECPSCGNDGTVEWKERYYEKMSWDPDLAPESAPLEDELDVAGGGGFINCTWCGHEWLPGPGMGAGGVCLTLSRNGYDGGISVSGNLLDWTPEDREPDGVIFCTAETVAKEWGAFEGKTPGMYQGMPTLKWVETVYLPCEVSEYSTWAVGNVYGYVLSERQHVHLTVTNRDTGDTLTDIDEDRWEQIDSCWGFISEDPEKDVPDWGGISYYMDEAEFKDLIGALRLGGR